MVIRGRTYRMYRWCSDSYGDSKALHWFKDRLLHTLECHCERHAVIDW